MKRPRAGADPHAASAGAIGAITPHVGATGAITPHVGATGAGTPHVGVTGAIIIPAHDEAAVIARALRCIAPLTDLEGIEVIVACNGCRDDTALIARGFAGVRVVEIDHPSKTDALNLADSVATVWPRLYLDADVEVDPQAVLRVFAALRCPGVLAARPPHVYDVSGATAPVRAYYRARSRIPGEPRRQWGAGAYGTNEAGHRRFGRFAAVTADDSWFDRQFAHDEKRIVTAPPTLVRTPRNAAALLTLLVRQRRGYVDLDIASAASSRSLALMRSVRGAQSAADAGWYLALTLASRLQGRRTDTGTAQPRWERDASSREPELSR